MMKAAAAILLLVICVCPCSFAYYTRDSADRICSGDKNARLECGYAGIQPRMCEARNSATGAKCCYDDTTDGVFWCFQPFPFKPVVVVEKQVAPVTLPPTTKKQTTVTTTTTAATTTTTTTTQKPVTQKVVTRRPFFRWPFNNRRTPQATTTTKATPTTRRYTTTTRRVAFSPTADLLGNTVATGAIFEQPKTTLPPVPSIFQFLTPAHKKPGSVDTVTEAPGTGETDDPVTEKSRNSFGSFLEYLGLEVDGIEVQTVSPGTGALGTNVAPSTKPPVGEAKSIINVEGVDVTTAICSYFEQNDNISPEIEKVFQDSLGDCKLIKATVAPEVANEVLRQQISQILAQHANLPQPDKKPTALDILNNPGSLTNFINSGSDNTQGVLNTLAKPKPVQTNNPFANLFGGGASNLGGGGTNNANMMATLLGLGGGTGNNLQSLLGGGLGGNSNTQLMSQLLGGGMGGGNSNTQLMSQLLGGGMGGGNTNSQLLSLLGGGGLGGNSNTQLLSQLLGGGGGDSSNSKLLMMMNLMKQQQQPQVGATGSQNVGVLQPSFIPTNAAKKPNSFLCNYYLNKMQGSDDRISQIMRIQFMNSGCLQSILNNPMLLLQDGGLDRIKQILGFSQPKDEFEDAATGPIDLALVPGGVLTECLQRRDEFSLNYNCKVGTNINIQTEQECTNVGCIYAPGNLCFRCPLIKTSAEANQLTQVTCSIAMTERQSCPGFERFYTITSILGRGGSGSSASSNSNYTPLINPSYDGTPAATNQVSGSSIGTRAADYPSTRQGLSSLFGGLGGGSSSSSNNALQQMLIQQVIGNQGGSNMGIGGIMGNFGGIGGMMGSGQSTLTDVLLKNKCTSMGCCWDPSQILYGISANACFKKSYPKTSIQINNQNCYDANTCGKQTGAGILHRIIGGMTATSGKDRPWQVLIRLKGSLTARCSGVLVCSQWVVTTASCLLKIPSSSSPLGYYVSREPTLLEAFVGSIDPANPLATGTAVDIEMIVPHPSYVVTQHVHDIALLKIAPIAYTESIKPVCLPAFASQAASANTHVFVAGYGSPGGTIRHSTLKEIKLKTISNADCKLVYKSSLPLGGVFCANPEKATEDTCKGDGGSPALVFNAVSGQYTLVGINFGGSPKCSGKSPLIFTDIARYRFWITQTTNGCCTTSGGRV